MRQDKLKKYCSTNGCINEKSREDNLSNDGFSKAAKWSENYGTIEIFDVKRVITKEN
jgi:hypothetical protein